MMMQFSTITALLLLLLACAASTVCSGFVPTAGRPTTTSSTALHAGAVLDSVTGRSQLDPSVIAKYNALPYPEDTLLAEYVWVDADGNTRSKTRTLPKAKVCVWRVCGLILLRALVGPPTFDDDGKGLCDGDIPCCLPNQHSIYFCFSPN